MPFTILVTGANKGIGYEAVKLLSMRKPDAIVLLGSRSIKNGEDAIEKMRSASSSHSFSNVKVISVDVTSASSLSAAAEQIKSTYNTLDSLIHNSGISYVGDDNKHPEIFNVNVRGVKACIEACLPLITPKTGRITVVSSTCGAYYQHEVDPSVRKQFEDIDGVTWEKVESWMQDWEKFGAGKDAKEKWIPFEKGDIAEMYWASKGMLNPWLRKWAKDHKDQKLAIVCPGERFNIRF
jgi:NAD(P)-dependent dehydrogenase (short-subunit alcohol dehydrogenase family)